MGDTNYFSSIVQILETPKQKFLKNQIAITTIRVGVPQVRGNRIIILWFWGNLARQVKEYYQVNDYILIEGYLSIRTKNKKTASKKKQKKVLITVLKTYPLVLNPPRISSRKG